MSVFQSQEVATKFYHKLDVKMQKTTKRQNALVETGCLHEGKFSQDIEKVSGPLSSYIGHGEFHLVERKIQIVPQGNAGGILDCELETLTATGPSFTILIPH